MFSSEIPVGHEGIAAKARAFERAANMRYFPEDTPKGFYSRKGVSNVI
jgi:hypothetical protein